MNMANLESQFYTVDLILAANKCPSMEQIKLMASYLPEEKREFFHQRVSEKILEAGATWKPHD